MKLLVILSLLIFIVYLVLVVRYAGAVPESLSETYYLLGNKYYKLHSDPSGMSFRRLRASIFTAMMWVIALLLMIPLLELTPELGKPLVFLALGSIMFVGAAPQFHDEMEGKVHTTAAIMAAIFGIVWALLFAEGLYWLLVSAFGCLVAALVTGTIKSSRTFWLEMVAFGTVYMSSLIMIF